MQKEMKILAIIPARGGSKRVLRKNIKQLAGKPLIWYSIEHAQRSKYVNRIIVSTEDEEISKIALSCGAEVPFLRPIELAGDSVTDFFVFEHALKWMAENEEYFPDLVVQLRPTSPLRSIDDVDSAIELLINSPDVDSVRSVIEAEPSPYKMYAIGANGLLDPVIKWGGSSENFNLPQQELPKAYRHIGTVDVIWPKTILEKKKMSGEKILPFIVQSAYPGINTEKDWEFYEFLFQNGK